MYHILFHKELKLTYNRTKAEQIAQWFTIYMLKKAFDLYPHITWNFSSEIPKQQSKSVIYPHFKVGTLPLIQSQVIVLEYKFLPIQNIKIFYFKHYEKLFHCRNADYIISKHMTLVSQTHWSDHADLQAELNFFAHILYYIYFVFDVSWLTDFTV